MTAIPRLPSITKSGSLAVLAAVALLTGRPGPAGADTVHQPLPFYQDWSVTTLITANDDWSNVPGVVGYRGNGLTANVNVDPQTVLTDGGSAVVYATRTEPLALTQGGLAEFELADPVVAIAGSDIADAPYLVLYLDASGLEHIWVSYRLRDLEGAGGFDNAQQQVALQFRTTPGLWINIPIGYVADATVGPGLQTVTPVSALLPAAADGAATLEVRVITTNAVLNDEWVGIDDIQVTGSPIGGGGPANFVDTTPALMPVWVQGAAWGDYDGDGDPDLLVAEASAKLMRNDGGVLVAATPGTLPFVSGVSAPAWGDYDNDGDLDLYLGVPGIANHLLRNDVGTFVDATSVPLGDPASTYGVAWAHYDLDGDIDLYITNYSAANRLFQNDGAGGFVDVTTAPLDDSGPGESAVWADFDLDGDPDLYLVNFGTANRMFRNDGGTFIDVTAGPLGDAGNGIGAEPADYDQDGDFDLYLANRGTRNRLFRNEGACVFVDATPAVLADAQNGITPAWGDFDNDGRMDLFLANFSPDPTLSVDRLFHNDGDGKFSDAASGPLFATVNSRTAAWADYDLDGDLDLFVGLNADPDRSKLFRNDDSSGHHWLHLDLEGVVSNRSAFGARVRLVAGGLAQTRFVGMGSGLSQHSLTVEFGLGSAVSVDTLQVFWPSGIQQDTVAVAADQRIRLIEHRAVLDASDATPPSRAAFALTAPNPFGDRTRIAYVLPVEAPVRLTIHDAQGRRVRTLVDGVEPAGWHSATWSIAPQAGLRAGVYFARLETAGTVVTRRIVYLR